MEIKKIQKISLRELWGREDKDFTAWLEKNIDYLSDVLGFDITIESREEKVGPFKVDLYGEDGNGNKLIIENQLEKTDHTHLGQIITYLTNLGAKTVVWITKEPTEEHTRAIEWLNEVCPEDTSFFLVKIEAIKIEGQASAAPLFTVIEGPDEITKEIGKENEKEALRHKVRRKFWTQFLEEINSKHSFCSGLSPSADNWVPVALGMSGVSISLAISKKYVRVEVFMNRGDKEENKKIFDFFYGLKNEIEKDFGNKLIWERMNDNVTSRIKYEIGGVNVFDEKDWPKMNSFLIVNVVNMLKAFDEPVKKLKTIMKK